MPKHNILITGANGLLGRHACMRLAADHNIHALVHKLPEDPITGISYKVLDFSKNWLAEDLPAEIDIVIHLVQSAKFREFPEQVMDVFDVNVRSTAMLLDYARNAGARHFIYASSGGVYGSGNGAFNENAPINTGRHLGYYLGSKLCGEILCGNYADLMAVSILRVFFMYGPEQKRTMLLPRLVDNVRAGRPIQLQGAEGLSINPVHVEDVVTSLKALLGARESRTINIAGKDVHSLKNIAGIIGDLVGKAPVFEYSETAPKNLVADISLMKNHLVAPKISLRQGLQTIL